MLTSFFGNSRPVNFLILGVLIFIAYLFTAIFGAELHLDLHNIFRHLLLIAVSVISMLLLDFIVTKNKLTKPNTFTVLFYSCFLIMLPVIFLHNNIILANLFLLLAIRRIISLRKDTNSSKKILDASVWITIASLFYFWSLLLFIPLWIAIVQKPNTDYKQMLTPLTGFFAVIIINSAYRLILDDSLIWFFEWKDSISLDFSLYNNAKILIPATVILGFYIWAGVFQILRLPSLSFKDRPNHLLLIYISAVAFLIGLASPEKSGAEFLFVLAPLSIITTNYIEGAQGERFYQKDALEFWFKEMLLWLIVVLACVFLFIEIF